MRISDWSSDVCSSDLNPQDGASRRGSVARYQCLSGDTSSDIAHFMQGTLPLPHQGCRPGTWCLDPCLRLEQIRVGWNRRRRSTDPVNLLYPFEVDRIHVVRWDRAAVPTDNDPI